MHKGIAMFGIRLHGRAGHSSNPAYGASALEGMADVIAALRAWRREMQATHRHDLFEVPVPTLNLGAIHGGDNPNRICGECELWIDVRPVPGQDLGAIRDELDRRLARALEGHPALRLEVAMKFEGIEPFETPATSAIVKACEELTGAEAGTVAFATEGPFLNALGCETVILGPGEISVAHQPDEHLPVDRIEPAVAVLERVIHRFCA
jgi:acetylornithine deacetylase